MDRKIQGYLLLSVSFLLFISGIMLNNYHQQNSLFMCSLVEQNPDIDMADCPAHNNNYFYYIVIIAGIGFGFFFLGIYYILNFNHEEESIIVENKKESFANLLVGEEKEVYDFLKLNEGSVYQSDIVKSLGFSKVKVTRILDKLEGKGLVDRKRRGMTNIIILKN